MMYGWIGKVLRVNLTEGTVKTEKLNEEWAKDYLGSRGLGTRYMVAEVDPKVAECLHISHLMEHADAFDLIHNNFDFLPLSYSRLIDTPMVTTIHGFSSPKIHPVYKKYNNTTYYVSISNSDRHPELDYIATVYNGVNAEELYFNPDPEDYLLFFGRIHLQKFQIIKGNRIHQSAQRHRITLSQIHPTIEKGLDLMEVHFFQALPAFP